MRITGSVEIAASPERVFAVLADPARMPEWQSDPVSWSRATGHARAVAASAAGAAKRSVSGTPVRLTGDPPPDMTAPPEGDAEATRVDASRARLPT